MSDFADICPFPWQRFKDIWHHLDGSGSVSAAALGRNWGAFCGKMGLCLQQGSALEQGNPLQRAPKAPVHPSPEQLHSQQPGAAGRNQQGWARRGAGRARSPPQLPAA